MRSAGRLSEGFGPTSTIGTRTSLRSLPSGIPAGKIVRQGIYTPDVGYTTEQITQFGTLFENLWRPQTAQGEPGQNWGVVGGNRFGKLGVVLSASHSYKEQFVDEERNFYAIGGTGLEPVNEYALQAGTQRAQLGVVGNMVTGSTTVGVITAASVTAPIMGTLNLRPEAAMLAGAAGSTRNAGARAPAGLAKLTSRTASRRPYRLARCSTVTTGAAVTSAVRATPRPRASE